MHRCVLLLLLPAFGFAETPKDKPDLAPTRLTVTLQQQTATQMLKTLGEQTGYKLVLVGEDQRKHNLTLRDDTFWEAIHKIERLTGYAPSYYDPQEGLHFAKTGTTLPHVFNQGLARLEITHIHEDRDIAFSDPFKKHGDREHLLTFTYRVFVEPRYRLWDTGRVTPKSILDETKQPFTQSVQALAKAEQGQPNWPPFALIVGERKDYLVRTNASAKSIKQLRGVLPVNLVVAKNKRLLSDALPVKEGTKFVVGKDTVEVRSCRMDGATAEVTLRLPYQYGPTESGYWHDRIQIETTKGERLPTTGYGSGSGNKIYEVSVTFDRLPPEKGQPAKLFIEDWQTVPYPITFEFADVRLP